MTARRPAFALFCALTITTFAPVLAADVSDWQQLKRKADDAYTANNYGLAEKSYLEALKGAEGFGPKDIRLADTLHQLVALYTTRGQFEKAQPMMERELRAREKALGGEHPQVVDLVGRLAQFYIDHGQEVKAERLTKLLLSFTDRKVKDQAAIKDEFAKLSKFYAKSKDYSESQSILKKLEESTAKTTANQDLELATTLDMLGRLYKSKGNVDIAERAFKNALVMRERTLSPSHMALAQSYENLSALYTSQGKSAEAQQYAKQSLEVTEKTLQPGRPEFFSRLDSLGRSYETNGHASDAESLYKRALVLIDQTSPESTDAGRASFALGTLYVKEGKYGAAEPLLKRALKISEGANGPQHASVAPLLDSYADVLEKLSKSGEAAKYRARARVIRGATTASTKPETDF